MAKRGTSQDKLADFAEDLGRVLGSAENKARGWLDQRKSIAKQLTAVRDKADALLRELTGGAARMAAAVNEARTSGPPGRLAGTKRGRRKFTAAQRKEQAARMKAYWAKRKASSGKKTAKKSRKASADSGGSSVGNG